ncbi:hypothetical protein ACFE04_008011 [Oxalis oulophora]
MFVQTFIQLISIRQQSLIHAATWTLLLTITVAAVSFAPESAFAAAVSPASSLSVSCEVKGFVRLPIDYAGKGICFNSQMVKRSEFDFFVPTVFAGVVVVGSAFLVRSFALGENDLIT